jgi:hypothetical protein
MPKFNASRVPSPTLAGKFEKSPSIDIIKQRLDQGDTLSELDIEYLSKAITAVPLTRHCHLDWSDSVVDSYTDVGIHYATLRSG